MIGNDIVDLHFFDSPFYHHVQYLDRICTPAESRVVRQSADPCRTLAIIWASKEAAYKLLSKQLVRCSFIPEEFVTHLDARVVPHSKANCLVAHAGARANVSICMTEAWVHAVATQHHDDVVHWIVRDIEKCYSPGCKTCYESEAARILATELLSNHGHEDTVVEFVGRVPTLRAQSGVPAGIGISLSHHGAFASAAIAWPSGENSPQRQMRRHFAATSVSEGMCSTCMV